MGVGVSQKSREGATSEADGAERRVEEGAKRVEEKRGGNSEETISVVGELERGGRDGIKNTHGIGREDMDEERRRETRC